MGDNTMISTQTKTYAAVILIIMLGGPLIAFGLAPCFALFVGESKVSPTIWVAAYGVGSAALTFATLIISVYLILRTE